MTATNATDVQGLVERYTARIREYAPQLGATRRFYAYRADDLEALAWDIQELDPSEQPLHDALKSLYGEWLDAMTPDERRELFAYNREQQGEWRNTILDEDLEPQYAER